MGKHNQPVVQALMPLRLGSRQLDLKQLEIQRELPEPLSHLSLLIRLVIDSHSPEPLSHLNLLIRLVIDSQ